MTLSFRRLALGAGAAAIVAGSAFLAAPHLRADPAAHPSMPGMADGMPQGGMMDHGQMMQAMHGAHAMPGREGLHHAATSGLPTEPGQAAFGAIQEIVQILDADPKTDWSKVDLEGLRQHLIDMNEVTLRAEVAPKPVEGGLEMAVTGSGRTLAAIRRMVPAQAQEIDATHLNGWSAKTTPFADGVLFTVTASDPKEVQHIRGLGFIGIMASGNHHQRHHLMMARGEAIH